jgi:hypothetical protein
MRQTGIFRDPKVTAVIPDFWYALRPTVLIRRWFFIRTRGHGSGLPELQTVQLV